MRLALISLLMMPLVVGCGGEEDKVTPPIAAWGPNTDTATESDADADEPCVADLTIAMPDGTSTEINFCADYRLSTEFEFDPDDPPELRNPRVYLSAYEPGAFECSIEIHEPAACGPGYYRFDGSFGSTTLVTLDCMGVGDAYEGTFVSSAGYVQLTDLSAGEIPGDLTGTPLSTTIAGYMSVLSSEGVSIRGSFRVTDKIVGTDAEEAPCAVSDGDEDNDGAVDAYFDGDDCDDDDPTLGSIATDADCDGTLTTEDCDDEDPASTTRGTDADCDTVLTADDCNDEDRESTTVATDADCDGVITDDDCDDDAPDSTIVATDADCDGLITEEDADDNDPSVGAAPCFNGVDDDDDGWIDSEDPDCLSSSEETGFGSTSCNNGMDDDEDGWTDKSDPICGDATVTEDDGFSSLSECNDGMDNDGHGDIDADDLACINNSALFEWEAPERSGDCLDGIDNDGDGYTDGRDPDCEYTPYRFEHRLFRDPVDYDGIKQCYDGLDNDGDGHIDAADAGCAEEDGTPNGFYDETSVVTLPDDDT